MMIMRLVSVSYGWPGAVDALAHWLTLLSLRSFLFCFTNTLLLYFILKMLSNSIIHPFVHQLTHCCQKTLHLAHSKAKTLSHLLQGSYLFCTGRVRLGRVAF